MDKQIESIVAVASPLVAEISKFRIICPADMVKSATLLTRCNKYLDELTTNRDKITKPIQESLKEVRARYNPIMAQIQAVIASLRQEQSRFMTLQVRAQKDAEQKIADKVSAGRMRVGTALKKMEAVEKPETVVAVEGGTLRFRMDRILVITDIDKIPKEYFDLNEGKLLKALKTGIVVAGATTEEKQIPVSYR